MCGARTRGGALSYDGGMTQALLPATHMRLVLGKQTPVDREQITNSVDGAVNRYRIVRSPSCPASARCNRCYHQLIPVTAVRVVIRIASNGPRNDHGRNCSVHREPLPRETAMDQRQPIACKTAAAKAVTSATKMACTAAARERDCARWPLSLCRGR
jgi:hypothetical protein